MSPRNSTSSEIVVAVATAAAVGSAAIYHHRERQQGKEGLYTITSKAGDVKTQLYENIKSISKESVVSVATGVKTQVYDSLKHLSRENIVSKADEVFKTQVIERLNKMGAFKGQVYDDVVEKVRTMKAQVIQSLKQFHTAMVNKSTKLIADTKAAFLDRETARLDAIRKRREKRLSEIQAKKAQLKLDLITAERNNFRNEHEQEMRDDVPEGGGDRDLNDRMVVKTRKYTYVPRARTMSSEEELVQDEKISNKIRDLQSWCQISAKKEETKPARTPTTTNTTTSAKSRVFVTPTDTAASIRASIIGTEKRVASSVSFEDRSVASSIHTYVEERNGLPPVIHVEEGLGLPESFAMAE